MKTAISNGRRWGKSASTKRLLESMTLAEAEVMLARMQMAHDSLHCDLLYTTPKPQWEMSE